MILKERLLTSMSSESERRLKENIKVFSAIFNLKVLDKLEEYKPVIVGTFPLGIETKFSDVDILVSSFNLERLYSFLCEKFSNEDSFSITKKNVKEEMTVIANFNYMQIPFEIFGQKTDSYKQTAYRHFLIEERLLSLGKSEFKNKIISLRKQGLKTEPAFASFLGLLGDPYDAILLLEQKSDEELVDLIKMKLN